jgi:hypothetical protein
VGRGGRPYGLSEEATQKSDDAIVASSLSVDMQLVDKRERERPIQVETFPAMVALSPHVNTPLANLARRREIEFIARPLCRH